MSSQVISKDGNNINITISLYDIYQKDMNRLAEIVSDGVITDQEMVEIISMKAPKEVERMKKEITDKILDSRPWEDPKYLQKDKMAKLHRELYGRVDETTEQEQEASPRKLPYISPARKQKIVFMLITSPSLMLSAAKILRII